MSAYWFAFLLAATGVIRSSAGPVGRRSWSAAESDMDQSGYPTPKIPRRELALRSAWPE